MYEGVLKHGATAAAASEAVAASTTTGTLAGAAPAVDILPAAVPTTVGGVSLGTAALGTVGGVAALGLGYEIGAGVMTLFGMDSNEALLEITGIVPDEEVFHPNLDVEHVNEGWDSPGYVADWEYSFYPRQFLNYGFVAVNTTDETITASQPVQAGQSVTVRWVARTDGISGRAQMNSVVQSICSAGPPIVGSVVGTSARGPTRQRLREAGS
ncbi:MAG: hypothetical protein ACK5MT_20000 [Actinomycetales bacterium]